MAEMRLIQRLLADAGDAAICPINHIVHDHISWIHHQEAIMKRASIIAVCIAALCFPIMAQGTAETDSGLIVFGAASLTEALTEIGAAFEEETGAAVTFNFDSSGTLKTQIEEGAPCDIFISAAPLQMDQLEEAGLIDVTTRLNLLENKVTLATSEGNPEGIRSFDDLARRLQDHTVFLAIGNSDVPVGQYTEKIFSYYGIDESDIASSLTYGSNVKEVTTQVSEGSVDCGIIYATDAFSAGLEVIDEATPEMCGQVIYPAAVIAEAADPESAKAFLAYLQGNEAMGIFRGVGFSPTS